MPLRVLVTGAGGFVGSGLVPALAAAGYKVRAATRTFATLPEGVESAVVGDLRRPVNLSEALRDVHAVVHGAGLAHMEPGVPEATYREINAAVTGALARAAKAAGVRRFVYLSSVRAQTGPFADGPVTEDLPALPIDSYGRSKLEGETLLADAGIASVSLRPVLVHGPDMRFNMAALAKLARSHWPLPLGGFAARRSILARDHLVEAILLAIRNEAMAGPYLVADPDALTIGEIVAALRSGWGRRPGLVPAPASAVRLAARMMGRGDAIDRVTRDLVVDPSRLRTAGWAPARSAAEALAETARRLG